MNKVKLGWIGAGFVGQSAHLEHFIKFDNCLINGLADLRPRLADKTAQSYNIPNIFYNHKDLLKCNDLDAFVAIVNRRHTFNVAKDVLESGRHLLTEKPMACTYNDAYELADLAEKKGLIYVAGFMRRYDTGVRKFKSLLSHLRKSSELGKVLSTRVYVEAGSDYCGIQPRITTNEEKLLSGVENIAPDWIQKDKKIEYESFVNVCTHDVNLIRFLFKEKPTVSCVDYRAGGVSYALLNFGEFPGIFEWGLKTNDSDGWKEGVEVRFEQGQVSLELPPAFLRNISAKIIIRRDSSVAQSESSIKEISSSYDWSFENSDKAFLDAIINDTDPDHAGKYCLDDFNIIDEIWSQIVNR